MSRFARLSGPVALAALVAAVVLHALGRIGDDAMDTVFAVYAGHAVWRLMARFGSPHGAPAGAATVAGSLAVLAVVPGARLTPYLAIALVNLGVAWVFLSGLRPGRRPVILQLVELMQARPETNAGFQSFVRGQCRAWVALTGATAAAGAVAMAWPAARPMADPAIGALLLGQVAFFLGSHRYAVACHGRVESTARIVAAMARPSTWERLEL